MINVGEIVVDPDFVQPFSYIRRTITWVNGRKEVTEAQYEATGTIISSELRDMTITPDGAPLTGNIKVWTHTRLMATEENPNYLADLVIYKGRRYIVHSDGDHSEYGYHRYSCIAEAQS